MEWLPSSGSEGENADTVDNLNSLRDKDGKIKDNSEILNMTGVRDLRQMENAQEQLELLAAQNPDNSQIVLNKQILDIEIEKKKKVVRSS